MGRFKDFVVESRPPVYLQLSGAELARRAQRARDELRACRACPRECGIDRLAGQTHACGTGRHAIVSSAFPHHGEEDCLRGTRGSGTIFFGLCNLRCVFCQNWDISQRSSGRTLSARELAHCMLELQNRGCHNINLVTPEHVAPQVIEALAEAVPRGLRLPVVYNTSAYDALHSLELLDGLVDIYMPDFKLWSADSAQRLLRARDYPDAARKAIAEMHRQVGPLLLDRAGLAVRGLLVRHLVMPGLVHESDQIFRWLADEVCPDTYVNIMGQYHPDHLVGSKHPRHHRPRYAEIDRAPTRDEMRRTRSSAVQAGLWRFDDRAVI